MPMVEDCALVQDFISLIEKSFVDIDSESKLNGQIRKMGLRESLTKIDVALNKRIDTATNAEEDTDECAGGSANESDDEGAAEVADVIEKPKCTLVIMPLKHQIKQFFELPNVFAKIQSHTAVILAQPTLNHFIKGL